MIKTRKNEMDIKSSLFPEKLVTRYSRYNLKLKCQIYGYEIAKNFRHYNAKIDSRTK